MSGVNATFPLATLPALKGSPAATLVGGPLSFYGVGSAFPIRLNATNSDYQVFTETALVYASVDTILNTHVSERPFLSKNGRPFGTRIRNFLFSNIADSGDAIALDVRQALDAWEPRVVVTSVLCNEVPITTGGAIVAVTIFFRYRSTNRSDNRVVAFYKP